MKRTFYLSFIATLLFIVGCLKKQEISITTSKNLEKESVLKFLEKNLSAAEFSELNVNSFQLLFRNEKEIGYKFISKRIGFDGDYNVIVKKMQNGDFEAYIQMVNVTKNNSGELNGYNKIIKLPKREEKLFKVINNFIQIDEPYIIKTEIDLQWPPNSVFIEGRFYTIVPGGVLGYAGANGSSSPSYSGPSEAQIRECEYLAGAGESGGGGMGGGTEQQDILVVEFENFTDAPGEDITKIFNCFDEVSDYGASYSIKLCSDVPINRFPTAASNLSLSVGHTFLVVTKSNGNQSVTKAFGFYPKSSLPIGDVPSKIQNDGNGVREINASIEMPNITQQQFDIIKNKAINLASLDYAINTNNCSNYAIDVFNSIRPSNSIQVAPLPVNIGNTNFFVNKSPQMLYSTLNQMKATNHPEANNIKIDLSGQTKSPLTTGGCN